MPDDNKNHEDRNTQIPEPENDVQNTQDVEDDMSDIFEDSDNMMITDEAIAVMAGVAASEVQRCCQYERWVRWGNCGSIWTKKSLQRSESRYKKRCNDS